MKRKHFNYLMLTCVAGLAVFSLRTSLLLKDISKCCNDMQMEIAIMKDELIQAQKDVSEINIRIDNFEDVTAEIKNDIEEINAKKNSVSVSSSGLDYVMRVVAAESMGEPFEGQMAVAQCIYETSKATGKTPEQVVKQPGQYASPVGMSLVNDSVREACDRVFNNGEKVTDEPIRYFYSTVGGFVSKWHENSLEYVMTIGNHKFFKAK